MRNWVFTQFLLRNLAIVNFHRITYYCVRMPTCVCVDQIFCQNSQKLLAPKFILTTICATKTRAYEFIYVQMSTLPSSRHRSGHPPFLLLLFSKAASSSSAGGRIRWIDGTDETAQSAYEAAASSQTGWWGSRPPPTAGRIPYSDHVCLSFCLRA